MSCSSTKGRTSRTPPASIESPTIWSPWSRYFDCSRTKWGTSSRHGPHHVAQKSRMTTLPRRSVSFTSRPSRSGSAKAGAVVPTAPPPLAVVVSGALPQPPDNASASASDRTPAPNANPKILENRVVLIELVVGDPRPVIVPLDALVLDELGEYVLAQRVLHAPRLRGQLERLAQAPRGALGLVRRPLRRVHLVDVVLARRAEREARRHALDARRNAEREREIGIARRIRAAELDTGRLLLARLVHRYPHERRPVPLSPGDVDRRLEPRHEPLVGVHPLVRDRGDLAHVGERAGQIGAAGLGQVLLVLGIVEDVLPGLEERLVHVHPAPVLAVDRLRHERGVVAALPRDLLHDVAVGDGLVGHLERFRVAEVDLVLAVRHLVVRRLDRDLHRLERLDRSRAELGADVVRYLIEVAGRVEERALLQALEV